MPKCYMCGKRKARVIDDTNYVHATTEPVFCGKKCAVAWALIEMDVNFTNGSVHLCSGTGEYEFDDRCQHCVEENSE